MYADDICIVMPMGYGCVVTDAWLECMAGAGLMFSVHKSGLSLIQSTDVDEMRWRLRWRKWRTSQLRSEILRTQMRRSWRAHTSETCARTGVQGSRCTLKCTSLAETKISVVTPQNVNYLQNSYVRIGELNGFGLGAPPQAQFCQVLRCERNGFREMNDAFLSFISASCIRTIRFTVQQLGVKDKAKIYFAYNTW